VEQAAARNKKSERVLEIIDPLAPL